MIGNNQQAFLELVRAGLWEKEARLSQFGKINFSTLFDLAEKQGVTGLVSAGLEHIIDIEVPQEDMFNFVGTILQIEQRNKVMNTFIANLVEKMRKADIYTLLVKGQGIAQCYERPMWRSCGDVDLLLSDSNYNQAKSFLLPIASGTKQERIYSKELGIYIGGWLVELHGSLRTGLSSSVDREIENVQKDIFYGRNVRSWINDSTIIFLPSPDNDLFLIFTHFIKHFYKEGGMSLRQICDWCRLLWTYKDSINHGLLESRLRKAGLMSEWKAFAILAVDCLGMPNDAMPLFCTKKRWKRKAKKIVPFILNSGKWRKWHDTMVVVRIFPLSTLKFSPGILFNANWLKIKERFIK